jgi:hypothetical protein
MKKILLLLVSFWVVVAMGQNLIAPITISLPANPPANTADWATAMPPFMITAQSKLRNGQVPGEVIESRVLVTIKNGGSTICGTYTQQTAPRSNFNTVTKNWSGAAALILLGKDCVLPPGTYELCVQFYNLNPAAGNGVLGEACKTFTIGDTKQQSYSPPQNLVPVDGQVLNEKETTKPIVLRWTPVVPKPKEDIVYKIRLYEFQPGQNKAVVLKSTQPVDILEVKNQTQTTFKLSKRYNGIIWNVEAVGVEKLQGGAPKNYGTSEATSFRSVPSDCTVDIKIDSIKCTPLRDMFGNQIYQVYVSLNNTGPNPLLFNSAVNIANNPYAVTETYYLKYLQSNAFHFPTTATMPASVPIGISSFNTQVSLLSTETKLRLRLHLYDNINISSCNPIDSLPLPNCACNPCKDKLTSFGTGTTTYTNNSISMVSTVTHGPTKVIKVSAQIVDFERLGEYGCLKCTKDSKEFGNYTGGSLNSNGGHIVNGGIGYGKQIQWQFTTPTAVSGFSYDLQMMVPPITEVSCCKDSIKFCIRWSFMDENCVTCDTLICTVVTREYKVPTIIWHPGGYAAQIAKMGEPYVTWYKQESNELPQNFNKQIEGLRKTNSEDLKKLKPGDLEKGMSEIFFSIRNLKSSTSSLWNAIQSSYSAGNINTMCGSGNFEDHILNTNEWSGGYGYISVSTDMLMGTDPILHTYTAGIVPAPGVINAPICNAAASTCAYPICASYSNPIGLPDHSTEPHQSIVSRAYDPILPAGVLNTTSLVGNNYSLRIGNPCYHFGTEYLSKKFLVTGTGIINFMYALVLMGSENTSFWVKVFDNTGNPINGVVYLDGLGLPLKDHYISSATDPFLQHDNSTNSLISYKDWSCATIKLDAFIGQTITVALVTSDCSLGAHWAYAYVDDWCGDCSGSTTGSVAIQPITDSCIKTGTQVCVNYTLPKIGTTIGTGTIKLKFYHSPGTVPVYTLTNTGTLSASGTYCFTIDPSQLPCTNGQGGYDVVAYGDFSITPSGGTAIASTFTSPSPINVNAIEGIKSGYNNDLVCCGTLADHCCDNFVKTIYTTVTVPGPATSGYTNIKFVPTFTAGPKPIKQIRISIINVETNSTNKDCLTCESRANFYGSMSVPQGITGGGKDAIEGMVYPTDPLTMACFPIPCPTWRPGRLSHEVIWGSMSGPGYNLMDGVGDQSTTFNVFVPKKSTLSCCDDTIKICVKYSFTDIDCKTCDTIICYKVINRQTINTYNPVAAVNLLKSEPVLPWLNNFGSLASLAPFYKPEEMRLNKNKRLFTR